jgi:hypothetical protein
MRYIKDSHIFFTTFNSAMIQRTTDGISQAGRRLSTVDKEKKVDSLISHSKRSRRTIRLLIRFR